MGTSLPAHARGLAADPASSTSRVSQFKEVLGLVAELADQLGVAPLAIRIAIVPLRENPSPVFRSRPAKAREGKDSKSRGGITPIVRLSYYKHRSTIEWSTRPWQVAGRLTTWACDGITEEYRRY